MHVRLPMLATRTPCCADPQPLLVSQDSCRSSSTAVQEHQAVCRRYRWMRASLASMCEWKVGAYLEARFASHATLLRANRPWCPLACSRYTSLSCTPVFFFYTLPIELVLCCKTGRSVHATIRRQRLPSGRARRYFSCTTPQKSGLLDGDIV